MNLFGKKKTEPRVDPMNAILRLRENISTVEKRAAIIEVKANNCLQLAKEKAVKDKKGRY
jgi:hypothetical protein